MNLTCWLRLAETEDELVAEGPSAISPETYKRRSGRCPKGWVSVGRRCVRKDKWDRKESARKKGKRKKRKGRRK